MFINMKRTKLLVQYLVCPGLSCLQVYFDNEDVSSLSLLNIFIHALGSMYLGLRREVIEVHITFSHLNSIHSSTLQECRPYYVPLLDYFSLQYTYNTNQKSWVFMQNYSLYMKDALLQFC
jgi:hypothetical protein